MTLPAEDQRLVAEMQEREFNIKKRRRAANAIYYEARRFRRTLTTLAALACVCVVVVVFIVNAATPHDLLAWIRTEVLLIVIGALLGTLLGQGFMRTGPGRRLLGRKQARLNRKYSGDLHAGRRWMQFFYENEDISHYVPQILYLLESEHRFDSVRAALEFAKQHDHENTQAQAHALKQFTAVAARTNLVVVSSVDAHGRPSSRVMRFVKTDRPGVWYITTAPQAPKVPEFDAGNVAVMTVPTEDGAAISSNRVHIRRADKTFMDVADLYRAQAPGYLDGMTEEDQRLELVYELTLRTAKVDSWVSHDLVSLEELELNRLSDLDADLTR